MANTIQAQVTDQSHGHTYIVYPGGTLNQHVGAKVLLGSSDVPVKTAPRLHRRCPAPSIHYTRRESMENHLDAYFFGNQPGQKRYVLHGLGGSGKTEAAKAFVYRCYYNGREPEERRFSDAFWVDATSTQTITESLQDIAEAADIKTEDVLTWFANHDSVNGNWIILFNNADDPELDLSPYFPDCSHGNILITTRNQEARRFGAGPGSAYGVSSMTECESRGVLLSHLQLEDPSNPSIMNDVTRLARELNHFPLSLGQAGAFIAKTHSTPRKYLKMLRTRREQLLAHQGKMEHPDKYKYTSIQAAWLISFERLSPAAKHLLWLCAFLHHDGILQTIFEYMITGLDNYEHWYSRLLTDKERVAIARLKQFRQELVADGNWSEFKFHELITELQSFSLILFIPERGTWSIHPLVHEWVRNTLKEDEQIAMRQQVLILLSSARGWTSEESAFDVFLALHLDEVLKGTTICFDGCRNEFGCIYGEARRWDDEVLCRSGFRDACEKTLGEDDDITLESISALAKNYWRQGKLDTAATLLLKVVKVRKKKHGTDNLDTLIAMSNLGVTYRNQGRLDDAAKLQVEVIRTLKRKLGGDHLETLTSMAHLAVTYRKQGRLDDAATLQLAVMETRKTKLGIDHLDTLEAMASLATTYGKQRRLDDAAALDLEVMLTRKSKLGSDHLDTLEAMAYLAYTYCDQGRLDDAATLQFEVMETLQRKLGRDHLETLKSMSHLAITYQKQKRLDDAATLQLEVVLTQKRKLGSDHLETLKSMIDLATTYWKQARFDDAATLDLEVLETRKRKFGNDHLDTLEAMASLAYTYQELGRIDEAAELLFQAIEGLSQKLGVNHADTRNAIKCLETIHQDIEARNSQIGNPVIPATHSTSTKDSQDVSKVLSTEQKRTNTRHSGSRIVRYFREMKRKLRKKSGSD